MGVDDEGVAALDAVEARTHARRAERCRAVRAVDGGTTLPCSAATSATPSRSSIRPRFVVPPVATTAKRPSVPCSTSARRRPSPVSRPSSERWTPITSMSSTRAAERIGRVRLLRRGDAEAGRVRAAVPLEVGVARRDERGEVAERPALHEDAAGAGRQVGQLREPGERLVLREDRAGALEPRAAVDRRRRDDEVEEHGRLRRRGGHEGEEARVVDGDRRGREDVREDPQRLLPAEALRRDRAAGLGAQRVGVARPVEAAGARAGCARARTGRPARRAVRSPACMHARMRTIHGAAPGGARGRRR